MRMLTRTVKLESWLRHLTVYGVLKSPTLTIGPGYYSERSEESPCVSLETRERPVPLNQKVQLASSWNANSTTERR